MYRPLPGAGGGSGPAYDDTEIRNAIYRDDGPYVASPLRAGETATYRVTSPLYSGTFRDLGLTDSADLIVTADGTTLTVPVTPDDTIGAFTQSLFLKVKAPIGFAWTGAGNPIVFTSTGGALAFTPNAVTKVLGLATGGMTSRILSFVRDGDVLKVPENYPTIAAAVLAARALYIPRGRRVKIQLPAGDVDFDNTVALDIDGIEIAGAPVTTIAAGDCNVALAGNPGAYAVTLTVGAAIAGQLAVGDLIVVRSNTYFGTDTAANRRYAAQSAYVITSKTSTTISYVSRSKKASLAGSGTLTACFIDRFATRLRPSGLAFLVTGDAILRNVGFLADRQVGAVADTSYFVRVENGGRLDAGDGNGMPSHISIAMFGDLKINGGLLVAGANSLFKGTLACSGTINTCVTSSYNADVISRGWVLVGSDANVMFSSYFGGDVDFEHPSLALYNVFSGANLEGLTLWGISNLVKLMNGVVSGNVTGGIVGLNGTRGILNGMTYDTLSPARGVTGNTGAVFP